jgi:hypothetical protein
MHMHTPDILNHLIWNSMDSWWWAGLHDNLYSRQPAAWNGPEEPIQQQEIHCAFKAQAKIGWEQFFHGRIAKAWWRIPIGTYYKIQQPGVTHSHQIS